MILLDCLQQRIDPEEIVLNGELLKRYEEIMTRACKPCGDWLADRVKIKVVKEREEP